jgi:hypothetical protein
MSHYMQPSDELSQLNEVLFMYMTFLKLQSFDKDGV